MWLWIDAISIDQNNIMERNHQVQMMAEIYSSAVEVYAWLGDIALTFEDAREARSTLRGIAKELEHRLAHSKHNYRSSKQHLQFAVAISKSQYWQRLWVVQEAILARQLKIHCSTAVFNLKGLEMLLGKEDSVSNSWSILAAFAEMEFRGHCYNLLWAVSLTAARECEEPRDRVYGFLGMVNATDFAVDYQESMDDLFLRVFEYFSQKHAHADAEVNAFTRIAEAMDVLLSALRVDESSIQIQLFEKFGLAIDINELNPCRKAITRQHFETQYDGPRFTWSTPQDLFVKAADWRQILHALWTAEICVVGKRFATGMEMSRVSNAPLTDDDDHIEHPRNCTFGLWKEDIEVLKKLASVFIPCLKVPDLHEPIEAPLTLLVRHESYLNDRIVHCYNKDGQSLLKPFIVLEDLNLEGFEQI